MLTLAARLLKQIQAALPQLMQPGLQPWAPRAAPPAPLPVKQPLPPPAQTLSPVEQAKLAWLQETDRKVRAHEAAHEQAAGALVMDGARYEYQRGPDGKQYAIGGRVLIDTSPGGTPEETIARMQIVRRAALAPLAPSPQDRQVAQQAEQRIAQAQAQLAQTRAPQ